MPEAQCCASVFYATHAGAGSRHRNAARLTEQAEFGNYRPNPATDTGGTEKQGCCTGGRDRFKRELQRLRAYRRAVVIEATLHDAMSGNYRSKLNPAALIASVASWQCRYEIPFLFTGDAAGAAAMTLAILKQFLRQCLKFIKAVEAACYSRLSD